MAASSVTVRTAPAKRARSGSDYAKRTKAVRVTGGTTKRLMMGAPAPLAPTGWSRFPNSKTGQELKFFDVAAATYACDTTGAVTLLNGIAQGDDVTTRDGRVVFNASVRIIGKFTGQDGIVSDTLCRVMLVWDQNNNSAAAVPAITDILTASTSVSHLNLNNRARFIILRDHMVSYGAHDITTATSTFSSSPNTGELDWYVRLGKSKTIYSGTTGVIGSIASGALYLVTIGDQAAGAGYSFNATSRVRFTE